MAGFKDITLGFIILIAAMFFIYNFVGKYLEVTNPSSQLLTDEKYQIKKTINLTKDLTETMENVSLKTKKGLENSNPDAVTYSFLISKALFEIPKNVFSTVTKGFETIPEIIFKGFGGVGSQELVYFIISIVFLILGIIFIIYVIEFIRTGRAR